MKIKFKYLKMHGFLSYLDAELSLDDNGFVFIKGLNENPNDNAASNGAGKSTIEDAINWILSGETIRGTKSVVSKYTTDGTYGLLKFSVDGHEYELLRSKDHKQYKTNLQITLDGKDISAKGIRDSEKVLQQYLPDINSSLIGSVIILGQGLPQKFTGNTPSGRKEVLEKLSKSDFMIEDLKSRVSQRKTELNTQLRKNEDTALSYESKIKVYEQQITNNKVQLNSLSDETHYDTQINNYQAKINQITAEIAPIPNQIEQLNEVANKYSSQLVSLMTRQNDSVKSIDDKYAEQLNSCISLKTQYQAQAYAVQQEIRTIESIKDVCPTCGQKLPNVQKPDVTSKKAQLATLQEQLNEANKQHTTLNETLKNEKTDALKGFQQEQSSINEELSKIHNQTVSLTNLMQTKTREKSSLEAELNSAQLLKSQLADKRKYFTESIQKCLEEISTLQDKLLYINNEKSTINAHLEVIIKFETIIKRDFRGYLLNSVIDYINLKMKEYSEDIFGTRYIEFVLNGNNIDISYDGKEYDSLSGGERQKVDIIVQFAIRDMLCKFLNFSSNILFLDEITDNLDSVGCQRVIDLITKKLTDVDSVYIISHHTDLAIPMDKEITVIKSKDGVSRIV